MLKIEIFSHCSGIIQLPIFKNSLKSISTKDAISTLSQKLSKENNEIVKLQKALLNDDEFLKVLDSFSELDSIQQISQTNQHFISIFKNLDSTYFQERIKDISDVCQMLINILSNKEIYYPDMDCILYVENITPYEVLNLPTNIKGLIIKNNSMLTHTSILLKEKNIPFANHIDASSFKNQECIFFNQKIFFNPSKAERELYQNYLAKLFNSSKKINNHLKYINLSSLNFPEFDFDEIGLFRTEMMALQLGKIPTEEEMYEYYQKLNIGKPVRIRLFDFGEDKKIDDSDKRGIGWLKANPKVLRNQLRSILRQNTDNFKILIPMVKTVEDVRFVREMIQSLHYPFPQIGAMIETKEAVENLEEILKNVDFVNVGTNDLTASYFGIDREDSNFDKNKLLELIKKIAKTAHKNNISVCVCGEVVKETITELVLMGVSVSVNFSERMF